MLNCCSFCGFDYEAGTPHTNLDCIMGLRLAYDSLLKVAKMVQRDLKADFGHVSVAVEAELDDAIMSGGTR